MIHYIKTNFKSILMMIVFALMIANVFLFSKTVMLSDKITQTENKISQIQIENQMLSKKVLVLTASKRYQEIASRSGFIKINDPIYIGDPNIAKIY